MPELDLDFVRDQFPAFREPSLRGWAFFENAGGSYACRQVIDRLDQFYRRTKVQPYGPYPASRMAGAWMDEAYERMAQWLCVGPDEVHFGPSTSQNVQVLANAFRQIWAEGDAVIVTNQDHEANSGPWRRLADAGIEVREWRVDEEGRLDPVRLDALLDDKVRLVAFPHASNIVAQINPAAEICARVRAAGAVSVVDGVSFAPHGLPDVEALGADVYLFSAYKTFGPHQGVMTVRRELADRLPNQGHFFNAGDIRKKLVPAGPDHAQVAALEGVVTYMEALDAKHFPSSAAADRRNARVRALIRAAETRLLAPLMAYLEGRGDARLLGPADPAGRAPTLALDTRRDPREVAERLAESRVMAGAGHFYAWRLIEALGIDPRRGVLRLSFTHYASDEEIDQLIAALDRAL
ncbi:aminotransferase class V-fold PLP-dependent enzyme [Oceanicella actignis]|uniref:Cysteine desulfurase family protein, VC1184 subfamily n=1 Tax=Oceanicella actignis TaxID=1189325 RepID=A0A1M7RR77_9RHOB|nr:aminotransferase class V-fold PLP-dependent enzyme [Oceanicella actignis]SET07149.1 cysteine desulfurase family protein, VC1184 subfamily [Oceanicella actignis]SHN48827.1 cysteine desulfurase family protein, VC1184 subfamily [Oceanicella actignis]